MSTDAIKPVTEAEIKIDHSEAPEVSKPEKYEGFGTSTQYFRHIGFLEVLCGDLVLRGRHGERDHLYPLDKAIARYVDTMRFCMKMARSGIKGWDVLKDICDDFKAKILEAVEQRRKLNRDIPQLALLFEQKYKKN